MTLKAFNAVDLSTRTVYHVHDYDRSEDYDFIIDYSDKDESHLLQSISKRKALEEAGAIVRFVEASKIKYDDGCVIPVLAVYVFIGE